MKDIRNELKIISIRYKIEKRTLQKIGHQDGYGWIQDLENYSIGTGREVQNHAILEENHKRSRIGLLP